MKNIIIKIEKIKEYKIELSDQLYSRVSGHLSNNKEHSISELLEALISECSNNLKLEQERKTITEKLLDIKDV
jgi:hypothetical protein